MTDREAGLLWESNADAWTALARQGYDVYRDLINTPAFFELLPEVRDLRGLDLGCGEGHNTRELARRGARMWAIDISPTFVRHAAADSSHPINYAVASGQSLPFSPRSFDFVTACMSLMDMPRPLEALREAARVLRPGGFLQFSITHPCFSTPHRRKVRDAYGREFAMEVGGYFEGGGGVSEWIFGAAPPAVKLQYRRFRTPMLHWTLAAWLNWIAEAGFQIEQAAEPHATPELAEKFPVVADTRLAPYFLHLRCRYTGIQI